VVWTQRATDLLKTAVPDGTKLAATLGRLLDLKDEAHYGVILVSSRKSQRLVAVGQHPGRQCGE
jgi:hypothetical protein